jgi:hypothetical protein
MRFAARLPVLLLLMLATCDADAEPDEEALVRVRPEFLRRRLDTCTCGDNYCGVSCASCGCGATGCNTNGAVCCDGICPTPAPGPAPTPGGGSSAGGGGSSAPALGIVFVCLLLAAGGAYCYHRQPVAEKNLAGYHEMNDMNDGNGPGASVKHCSTQ